MEMYRVGADDVARVVGEIVAAMIHDGLERPDRPEQRRLTIVQAGKGETDREADPVDGNGLQRVVVERPVGERDVDVVMHRMDVLYAKS